MVIFGRTKAAEAAPSIVNESDEADAGSARPVPFELAAIDLTLLDGRRLGWIATDGARTSDWMNENREVVVYGMREIPLATDLADPGLPGDAERDTHRLDRNEIVFAVPPPLPPNRHLRLHRRRVLIQLDIGNYRIGGQLHVRPGADAGDYVLRSSRTMVPLTEVELVHDGEPEFHRLLEVLIINARHVTRMVQGDRLASRPAPQAVVPAVESRPAAPVAALPARPGVVGGDGTEVLWALRTLLDANLLSIEEFQAKRAELMARGRA